uniref:Rna-directed dna polymerase from mobile element jockey-like n=1 Tax=Loa loa TaxID=7209 RepID=A0A1I7W1K0_LOALO
MMASLVGILLRARQGRYLVMADVGKAFLQMCLKQEDRDVIRENLASNDYNKVIQLIDGTVKHNAKGNRTLGLKKRSEWNLEMCWRTWAMPQTEDFPYFINRGKIAEGSLRKAIDTKFLDNVELITSVIEFEAIIKKDPWDKTICGEENLQTKELKHQYMTTCKRLDHLWKIWREENYLEELRKRAQRKHRGHRSRIRRNRE